MADNSNSILGWIVAGGGGTLLGSIIMSVIQTVGSRGKARADAADITVNAAAKIMDRLQAENMRMREAIIELAEACEAIADELPPSPSRTKIKKAIRAAKIAAV